jgi:predicted Co/Zn/Cd cation transporter (cation efflux family)
MTPIQLKQKLEREIKQAQQDIVTFLINGAAQDYSAYREKVGQYQVLEMTLVTLEEAMKDGEDD